MSDDVVSRALRAREEQLRKEIAKANRETERARAMVQREIDGIRAALNDPRNEPRRADLERRLAQHERGLRAIG